MVLMQQNATDFIIIIIIIIVIIINGYICHELYVTCKVF